MTNNDQTIHETAVKQLVSVYEWQATMNRTYRHAAPPEVLTENVVAEFYAMILVAIIHSEPPIHPEQSV